MIRRASPALLVALMAAGCFARQYRSNPRVAIVDGDPIVQMQPPGRMPSVLESRLVTTEKHSDPPDEVERVMGLVFGSEARAYPLGLLDKFEVVNDAAAGLPYVVARCGLTGITAVYDRRLAGLALTFENSGALWRDTLVLRDRETGTYWTAASGQGLSGPLAGQKLASVPAAITSAENWRKVHPESLYLDLDRSTAVPIGMRLYEASSAQGISGEKTGDKRYGAKEEVFLAAWDREALAFKSEEIEKAGLIETTLAGHPVSIEWDAALGAPRAYSASHPSQEIALIPMYWFAVGRHFARVRTLREILRAISEEGTGRPVVN